MTIKHKSFVWVCKKENKLRGKRGAREREIERETDGEEEAGEATIESICEAS